MAEPPSGGFFNRIDPEGRMTFMQHLMELRNRIMVAVFSLLALVMLALFFYKPIIEFLDRPIDNVNARFREDEELCRMIVNVRLDPSTHRKLDDAGPSADLRNRIYDGYRDPSLWEKVKASELPPGLLDELKKATVDLNTPIVTKISTDPLSTTLILMSVAFWVAVVLGSPIIIYEVWAFVSPGLKPREKAAIRPVLVGGVFFFAMGAAACYYIIFPLSMAFFVWLDLDMGYLPSYTPETYINLLITFMLITGAIFEIPMVVAVLAKLGILSPGMLLHYWRMIVLTCFILGAFISPGNDIISMITMSGALLFLYIVSLIMAWICYRPSKS